MSLTIKRVVNTQIATQGQIAKNRDFSVIAILTDEPSRAFDSDARFLSVSSVQDVALNFGSNTRVAKAAKSLFATQGIKRAIVAKWVKSERTIEALPNELRGSALNVGINKLKVTDGVLTLNLAGQIKSYNVNLSTAIDFNAVATALSEAMSDDEIKAVYDEDANRFKIVAKTAGAIETTKIGYAQTSQTGTSLAELLNLIDGKADIILGRNSKTESKESITEALDKLFNQTQGFYGIYSASVLSDEELIELESWATSAQNPCVVGYTITRYSQLENTDTNAIKKIAKKDSGRLFAIYNNTGDEHAGLELLAQAVNTNWEASNAAKTLKFKQLQTAQSDDKITLNEAEKCDKLGVNYYTDYDGVNMTAEGVAVGGRFIDEVVGLDAFNDRVQKEVFSVLKGALKVPQTDKGQVRLIAAVKRVCEQFKFNGFIAEGQWRGDPIGGLESGMFLDLGYYIYSPSYNEQLQTDREARKAVPISVALKLAGAIHSVDILINYNR
ncbi:DUF3383 family protein [Campylobacter mucosalis]|uniref:DUF3383 family protein n=1 Tax=Campylobacter mucosalis TaxID=202 RepID=UPI0014700100|nr:DUF3383 family protein [Campylobacter mucosalis]